MLACTAAGLPFASTKQIPEQSLHYTAEAIPFKSLESKTLHAQEESLGLQACK